MALLYLAKLRISEVAQGRMGQFYALQLDGVERWWLVTHGKGGKLRKVAVVPDLLAELIAYRESCGLPPLPSPAETAPLVGKLRRSDRHGAAISVSALHKVVKEVFRRAVVHCREQGNPGLALRLEHASAHWLRHSGASHLLLAGADLAKVRDQLGHASVATTNTYLNSAEMARHDAIAGRLRLGWASAPERAPTREQEHDSNPADTGEARGRPAPSLPASMTCRAGARGCHAQGAWSCRLANKRPQDSLQGLDCRSGRNMA
jgi:integrase